MTQEPLPVLPVWVGTGVSWALAQVAILVPSFAPFTQVALTGSTALLAVGVLIAHALHIGAQGRVVAAKVQTPAVTVNTATPAAPPTSGNVDAPATVLRNQIHALGGEPVA